MESQIHSPLKPDIWQKYLSNYWDSQLVLLLRYGVPLDFDYTSPLESVDKNRISGIQHAKGIQVDLNEEKAFGAILSPFQKFPIDDLHVPPFLTRDKPGGSYRQLSPWLFSECRGAI